MVFDERVFQLTDERHLARCSTEPSRRGGDDGVYWIDIRTDERETLADRLQSLELHPLALEACLGDSPGARLVAYGDSLVVILPTHATWDAEERTYIVFAFLPGLLVSIHQSVIPALDRVAVQYAEGMRFHGRTTSAILYQIIDHLIDEDIAFTLKTRDAIDELEELLEEDADGVTERSLPLKRQITRLAAAFEDQLYCVGSLQTIESKAFQIEGLGDFFRDAFTHLEHASRTVCRQLAHLSAIQQAHQLRLQDRTNRQLRVLTIVSTIFIPLTLITGIYGMNFRYMPELQWRYGYFGALGAMVAVAAGMLALFYRTGWFR